MTAKVFAVGLVTNLKETQTSRNEPLSSFVLQYDEGQIVVRFFGKTNADLNIANDQLVIVEGKLKSYNNNYYIMGEQVNKLGRSNSSEHKERREYEQKNYTGKKWQSNQK